MDKNVVILTRVSTKSQSYERQVVDLKNYANSQNDTIVGEFNEKISGAVKNEARQSFNMIKELLKTQNIDKVLVWEVSRLGRNTGEVLKMLEYFHSNNISIYIYNYNLETINPDGSINQIAQLVITLLAEFARTERAITCDRLRSGYNLYRKNGGTVGRKQGSKKSNSTLLKENKDVVKYLKRGYSIRDTMKLTNRSTGTIQKIKKIIEGKVTMVDILEEHADIAKLLLHGVSQRATSEITEKSIGLVKKVHKLLPKNEDNEETNNRSR